jgi:hypothetical protein
VNIDEVKTYKVYLSRLSLGLLREEALAVIGQKKRTTNAVSQK